MGIYSSHITGIRHGERVRFARKLKPGAELQGRTENGNPHDGCPVALLDCDDQVLGYIPYKDAGWISKKIDKRTSIRIVVKDVRKKGLVFARQYSVDIEILTGADAS